MLDSVDALAWCVRIDVYTIIKEWIDDCKYDKLLYISPYFYPYP